MKYLLLLVVCITFTQLNAQVKIDDRLLWGDPSLVQARALNSYNDDFLLQKQYYRCTEDTSMIYTYRVFLNPIYTDCDNRIIRVPVILTAKYLEVKGIIVDYKPLVNEAYNHKQACKF